MEPDFWHDRWKHGKIGFHRPDTNPALPRHWPRLKLGGSGRVLVPLAGKSRDMHWLASQGHAVVGVELSPVAAEAFFEEAGWTPSRRRQGAFEVYASHGIEIMCGDFFSLAAGDLEDITGVYDRAALIALPGAMRQKYVERIAELLPEKVRGLLVTIDYGKDRTEGPPFSVPEEEVRALLVPAFHVELFERGAPEDAPGGLKARGIDRVTELVFGYRRG